MTTINLNVLTELKIDISSELYKHFAQKYVDLRFTEDYIEIYIKNFFGTFLYTVTYQEYDNRGPKDIVDEICKSFIGRSTDKENADGTR